MNDQGEVEEMRGANDEFFVTHGKYNALVKLQFMQTRGNSRLFQAQISL